MTPEISLLIRAVVLSLLVLGVERAVRSRQLKRDAQRGRVVRLPAEINPVVSFPSRPVQVSVAQVSESAGVTGQPNVLRLEPQAPAYVTEKQAA